MDTVKTVPLPAKKRKRRNRSAARKRVAERADNQARMERVQDAVHADTELAKVRGLSGARGVGIVGTDSGGRAFRADRWASVSGHITGSMPKNSHAVPFGQTVKDERPMPRTYQVPEPEPVKVSKVTRMEGTQGRNMRTGRYAPAPEPYDTAHARNTYNGAREVDPIHPPHLPAESKD